MGRVSGAPALLVLAGPVGEPTTALPKSAASHYSRNEALSACVGPRSCS